MKLVKPSTTILTKVNPTKVLQSIEKAGRTCYKSEDKITADSAGAFVRRIIKSGHHSVLEHESISVKITCDRGVSHELVRHRIASFSQESTRYCSYKDDITFIIPPWVNIPEGIYTSINTATEAINPEDSIWFYSMQFAKSNYLTLLASGWSAQQARSVLNNSLKTEVVMTCNLREWLYIFNLRCSKAAHPQMIEIMLPLLKELYTLLPAVFIDIYNKYFPLSK